MSDSFFDMPAGYTDADMEMSAMVERGNWHHRMVRRYGEDRWAKLLGGDTVSHPCRNKATGASYTVMIRLEYGEYLRYSMDGARWFDSARDAYTAALAV